MSLTAIEPDRNVPDLVGGQQWLTDTAADIPEGLDFDEWASLGKPIERAAHSSQWWLGDWVLYGDRHFADRDYTQAVAATGLDVDTVRVAAWVASAFPPHRRRPHVPFAHHQVVANLEPDDADALLEQAEREGLTRDQLRRVIRQHKAIVTNGDASEPAPIRAQLIICGQDGALIREALDKTKVAVEQWLRAHACQAEVTVKV